MKDDRGTLLRRYTLRMSVMRLPDENIAYDCEFIPADPADAEINEDERLMDAAMGLYTYLSSVLGQGQARAALRNFVDELDDVSRQMSVIRRVDDA